MRVVLKDVNWEKFVLRFDENVEGLNKVSDFTERAKLSNFLKLLGEVKSNSDNVIVIKHDDTFKYIFTTHFLEELAGCGIDVMDTSLELLQEVGVLSKENYDLLISKGVEELYKAYVQGIVSSKVNPGVERLKEYKFGMKISNFNKLREVSQKTKVPQEMIINLVLEDNSRKLVRLCLSEYEKRYSALESKLSSGKHFTYKGFDKIYDEYKLEYTAKDDEGNIMRDALVVLYRNHIYVGSIQVDLLKLDDYIIE